MKQKYSGPTAGHPALRRTDRGIAVKTLAPYGLLVAFICVPSLLGAQDDPELARLEQAYQPEVRPLLKRYCYKCHSAEAEKNGKLEGKLRLDLREGVRGRGESGQGAVGPGKPDESNLYRAVTYLDSELVMPPKSRLAKSVVADFKPWIEMGAPDPRRGTLAKAEANEIDFEQARKFWSFRKQYPDTPFAVLHFSVVYMWHNVHVQLALKYFQKVS